MRLPAAAALLGAAVLAGCGGSSGSSSGAGPRTTVERYFAAVATGRSQAACDELTEQSRQRLADFAKPLHSSGTGCSAAMGVVLGTAYGHRLSRLAHARITSLAVHGSTATAAVDGVDKPLQLVRENSAWRIDFTPSVEADKLP